MTIYGGLYVKPDEQCGIWLNAEQMRVLSTCGIGWGVDVFVSDTPRRPVGAVQIS